MAEGLKVSIEKLDVDNYTTWSQQMKFLLVHKKLWKGVADPAGDADRTEEAKAVIGLNVRSQHLGTVTAAANAKVAWDALEAIYKGKSATRKLQLRQKLITLKQGSGESVAAYVDRARDLERELVSAGSDVKPDDLAMSVLSGLSKEYGTVVTVLMYSDKPVTEGAMARGERLRWLATSVVSWGTSSGSARRGLKGPQGSKESGKPKFRKGRECYGCGSTNHILKDCPKGGGSGSNRGAAFMAGDGVGAGTGKWVLDSGATQHMSGDKGKFTTLKMLETGSRRIRIANGTYVDVAGEGTVELRCLTPTGVRVNTLLDVLYVLGVVENLFSVTRATDAGVVLGFKRGVCQGFLNGEIIFRAEQGMGLFEVCEAEPDVDACMLVRQAKTAELWHRRLGHAGCESLAKMVEGDLVRGVGVKAEAFREKKPLVNEILSRTRLGLTSRNRYTRVLRLRKHRPHPRELPQGRGIGVQPRGRLHGGRRSRGRGGEATVLDSGATQHMSGNKGKFTTLKMLEPGSRRIRIANDTYVDVAGEGTVELRCLTPTGVRFNTLLDVLYVPGVVENLFSVTRATDAGVVLGFKRDVCQGFLNAEPEVDACMLVREAESAELWHRRLGHAGYEGLAKMVEGDLVRGVGVKAEAFREKKPLVCEPCIMRKQTRESFPRESDSKGSTEPLELVHMDVCGPMPVASPGGCRWLATFLDDYTKLSVVQPLKKKSEVTEATERVFARLELQSGKKVKSVQTDRGGGEYVNEKMTPFLGKKGTVQRTTAGHSPEQNGSAERLNRTLEERARALLEDAGLGGEYWAEAMVTANYTRNRVPSSVHGKTPYEMFYGEKPDLSHMRVFGARAYIHVPKENRKKLERVSERGVFLGYKPNAKAYRVLKERTGVVIVSRDVVVDERGPSGVVELGSVPGKEEGGARDPSRVSPPTQMGAGATPTGEAGTQPGAEATPTGEAGTGSEESVLTEGADESGEVVEEPVVTPADLGARKNPPRERRLPERFRVNLAAEGVRDNPPKESGEHPEPQAIRKP
ncbi:hypothetical protein KFL_004340110 [Klebsormidium nitens]|uniref:Uncharacterized protein n=1 Tax=Klebsormidium nitens TaxID=105231 RepID=A0A1Y1IC09_KLENI|nr:hypothetical protein KFL_004340110 [Klebsormidium nitens]|eukprot:GAQ88504.1 hypothetical protein KFL_004340110 [Klebsormidium nitens]